jgi:hypothetical protein
MTTSLRLTPWPRATRLTCSIGSEMAPKLRAGPI